MIPLLILTIGAADHEQLKPVLADGFLPVLQGAILPAGAFMNQLFILGWLLPYLNQPKKALKVSLYALLCIFIFVFFVVLTTILVLGSLTGQLNYSYLSVMQYIGIEGSFERLEAIAVMVWVIGSFVKVSVSLFIISLSISEIFGIRNYRDLVAPITLLCLIGSVWVFKNGAELQTYLTLIYPSGGFVTQSLIPLFLLLIDTIKRKAVPSAH
ncbi:GerAB/ArcD/ProY family transporter [Paenibacillus sp. P36]|uniref:GerAB/ArcD/ProY family transporter n=1 Tax=Paenibacillus sp. P36 TaxID=3342538 RepID=UPI0038B31358